MEKKERKQSKIEARTYFIDYDGTVSKCSKN